MKNEIIRFLLVFSKRSIEIRSRGYPRVYLKRKHRSSIPFSRNAHGIIYTVDGVRDGDSAIQDDSIPYTLVYTLKYYFNNLIIHLQVRIPYKTFL